MVPLGILIVLHMKGKKAGQSTRPVFFYEHTLVVAGKFVCSSINIRNWLKERLIHHTEGLALYFNLV